MREEVLLPIRFHSSAYHDLRLNVPSSSLSIEAGSPNNLGLALCTSLPEPRASVGTPPFAGSEIFAEFPSSQTEFPKRE